MRHRGATSFGRITAAFAAASASLWSFLLFDPETSGLSSRSPAPRSIVSMRALVLLDTTPDDLIARAVERDPFGVRRAPAELPSLATEPAPPPEPTLRVLGTVVDSLGGSFAFCQLGSAQPSILRVGQKIGTYELRAVEQGSATFAGPDGVRLERRVPRAGA